MNGASAALLPDGKRLHLQHGPIDLIIEADGEAAEIRAAYHQATEAFTPILADLVTELELLRSACISGGTAPSGEIAARMHAACLPHCDAFITPMAAVAGAVADHVLRRMLAGRRLERAYVNNGGDIAFHLSGDRQYDVAICANPETGALAGHAIIRNSDRVRGLATSGWRGRSFSLGVADMVTVLAVNAASADAAATMIANAVDPGRCREVIRRPAREISPDSDLGELPVTVEVGPLSQAQRSLAIDNGMNAARRMAENDLIEAALIAVQGELRVAGQMRLGASRIAGTARGRLVEDAA